MVGNTIFTALSAATFFFNATFSAFGESPGCHTKTNELSEHSQLFLRLISNNPPVKKIALPTKKQNGGFHSRLVASFSKALPIDKFKAGTVWSDLLAFTSLAPRMIFKEIENDTLSSSEDIFEYARKNGKRGDYYKIFIKGASENVNFENTPHETYKYKHCQVVFFGDKNRFALIKSDEGYYEHCINMGSLIYYGATNAQEIRRTVFRKSGSNFLSYEDVLIFASFFRRAYGAPNLKPVRVTTNLCEVLGSLKKFDKFQ